MGLSRDSLDSHRRFAQVAGIQPPLVADPEGRICKALGVLDEATGKTRRTTFVIDRSGIVRYVFEAVKVPGHAAQVLEAVRGMAA